MNSFTIPPLATLTRELADVAAGRHPPDVLITGARLLSTYTERLLGEKELWIYRGRIAAIQPAGTCRNSLATYDAGGGIIAPGLVDPHVHIESSMMSACAYAEGALLNGTTTIFCDSHEIANVCDVAGIEWMLEDARESPLSIFLTVPSTVPATSADLETAGGDLTPEKIGGIFDRWPEAVALGEKMDFVPVTLGDPRSHAIIAEALRRGRPVCGHIYGRAFVAAYAASGITDTHEAIDREIADDFLEAGIWVFLRGGPPTTPWHSLPEAVKTVTELGASTKRICVCTDDRDADDLFAFGLDWVTRQLLVAGIPRERAWSMGSLHAASRYGMDGEIGGLGGGRRADLVLLNDDLEVQNTWLAGALVVENKKITRRLDEALSEPYRYPAAAYRTVHFAENLRLIPELPTHDCIANIIKVANIVLIHEKLHIAAAKDWPALLAQYELCFVSVIERHGKTGGVGYGLLKGFGLTLGAVASSVGHDAHNVIVAGTNEPDMQFAARIIRENKGGVCVVRDRELLALIELPIAGLLSDQRAGVVAERTANLKEVWRAAGCVLPYMGFNLIPLSVIPEIRLTDRGLVLVPQMQIVPLFQ